MITSTQCEEAEKRMAEATRAIGRLSYIAANYEPGHALRLEAERAVRNAANKALQALLELIREEPA